MLPYTRTFLAPSSHSALSRNMGNDMLSVVGYVRVSTDLQAEYGLSLDAQKAEIERYCRERDYTLAEVYVDGGFSAKNTDRPAFKRMVARVAEGGIHAIVCAKLDRLTRSLRDICAINEDILEPHNVNLVCIRDGLNTLDPTSKMLLPFLALIGQIERKNTSERVKSTIRHIRNQGGHYGKIPFGYTVVEEGRMKRLVECEHDKPWLDKMIAWYREGVGVTEIAQRINEAGIKPRYAQRFTKHSVYELLVNHQVHKPKSITTDFVFDKERAYKIAYALRSDGAKLETIVKALTKARLRPKHAGVYKVTSVQDLLRSAVYHDRKTPHGYARYLKEQGHSLRAIGGHLLAAGHRPPRGGQWHPHQVKMLLLEVDPPSQSGG